jgi:hypothetical protein
MILTLFSSDCFEMKKPSSIPEFFERARDRASSRTPLPYHVQRAVAPNAIDIGAVVASKWTRSSFVQVTTPCTASVHHVSWSAEDQSAQQMITDHSGELVLQLSGRLVSVFRTEELVDAADSRRRHGESLFSSAAVSLNCLGDQPRRRYTASCFMGENSERVALSRAQLFSVPVFDLEIVDEAAPAPVATVQMEGYANHITSVSAHVFAAATSAGTVAVCDVRSKQNTVLRLLPHINTPIAFGYAPTRKSTAMVAVSSDGAYFVAGSADNRLLLWDARSNCSAVVRHTFSAPISSIVVSDRDIVCNTINGQVVCFDKTAFYSAGSNEAPLVGEVCLYDGSRMGSTVSLPVQELMLMPDSTVAVPCYRANELVILQRGLTGRRRRPWQRAEGLQRRAGAKFLREEFPDGIENPSEPSHWRQLHSVTFGQPGSFPVVTCGVWLDTVGRLAVANDQGFIEMT